MNAKKNSTKKTKSCLGMDNLTPDGYFLPFFDYDKKNIRDIKRELSLLQRIYSLSDIYLIQSTRGYNAFSLDKLPYNTLLNIIDLSRHIDNDYRRIAKKRGYFTIRLGPDKKIKEIILNYSEKYEKSLCHAHVLHTFFNYEIDTSRGFDTNSLLNVSLYKSKKYGYLKADLKEKHP